MAAGRATYPRAPQIEIPHFGSGLSPQSARTLPRTRSEADAVESASCASAVVLGIGALGKEEE